MNRPGFALGSYTSADRAGLTREDVRPLPNALQQTDIRHLRAALINKGPASVYQVLVDISRELVADLKANGAPEETWKPYLSIAERVSKVIKEPVVETCTNSHECSHAAHVAACPRAEPMPRGNIRWNPEESPVGTHQGGAIMSRTRFAYFAKMWNERTRSLEMVRVSSEGRNLSRSKDIPAEYATRWARVEAPVTCKEAAELFRINADTLTWFS